MLSRKNKERSKIERKGSLKYLPDLLLAMPNLLGPVGSVFAGALGGFFTTKRFSNIEHTLEVMGKRIEHLKNKEINSYLCSDEFVHLFLDAIQKAQYEHQEEKRRLFGVLLSNMVINREVGYDLKTMFISLVAELDYSHIGTLQYLGNKAEAEKDSERWASLKEIKSQNPKLEQESDYVLIAVLQKLANSGMIKSKGISEGKIMRGVNPVGLWFHSLFGITDLGRKFLDFLKD
jgi:hypothetical protein